MGEHYTVDLGNPLPLSYQMQAAASSLFPRARIYDSADSEVAGSPFNLTEVGATARYTGASFTPTALGTFVARFVPFTDAGHTIEARRFSRDQDSYTVVLPPARIRINPQEASNGDINLMFWLERDGAIVAAPTDFTFEIRDGANNVIVATVSATAGPDNAHGVYFRTVTPTIALASGDTYSVLLSITDATGTVSGQAEGTSRA